MLPGESAYLQLILEKETFNTLGDMYIIRSFDDKRTLGGGIILDATDEKKKRFNKEDLQYLKTLDNGSIDEKMEAIINRFGKFGISVSNIISKINFKKDDILEIIRRLDVKIFDKKNHLLISNSNLNNLTTLTINYIEEFHKINPKSQGISLEELRNKIHSDLNYNLFQFIIDTLLYNNKIVLNNSIVSSSTFSIQLTLEDEKNKNLILEIIEKGGTSPPLINQIQKEMNLPEKDLQNLLTILVNEDKLVKIKPDLYIGKPLFEKTKEKLINFLEKNKEISIQDFKKIINTSRKYLIPLLEYFDSKKITVRKGDKRVLKT